MTDETTEIEDEFTLPEDEGDEDEGTRDEAASEGDDDEFAIEMDGEVQEDEPDLVKHLRAELRDRDKKLAAYAHDAKPRVELGPKPTLEGHSYDEEAYESALDKWKDEKREAEAQEAEDSRVRQAREAEDQRRLASYRAKAAALPVKDFAAAEELVVGRLPHVSQAALLAYTDDPAKMVYALAKHPQMLDRIASEPDPIKQIIMAREMEGKLKVTTRKKPPAPESGSIQRSSAPLAMSSDKEEARLEKEAERTGDRTALIQYRRQRKAAA